MTAPYSLRSRRGNSGYNDNTVEPESPSRGTERQSGRSVIDREVVGIIVAVLDSPLTTGAVDARAFEYALLVEPERREGLLNGGAVGIEAVGQARGGDVSRLADTRASAVEGVEYLLVEVVGHRRVDGARRLELGVFSEGIVSYTSLDTM
jgi:hypothetical protein